MDNKNLLIAGIILFTLLLGVFIWVEVTRLQITSKWTSQEEPYQGPMPENADEKHFRETGETLYLNGKPYKEVKK